MRESVQSAAHARTARVPLWDEYGQAQRFAGALALAAAAIALSYVLAGTLLVAEIFLALALVLAGLRFSVGRAAPPWALGLGTPAAMTACALVLLLVTGGRAVGAVALLAIAPAVAVLWSSAAAGWTFLGLAFAISALTLAFAPLDALPGAEPWISDRSAPWVVAPLAAGLLLLARMWLDALHVWHGQVTASHAVLTASEARFKAYIENAHDVLAELDVRGKVLFITASKEVHYALPVADLLGTQGAAYIHPDDIAAARRCFEAAARAHPNVSAPLRYHGSRDGWRWLRVAVSAYRTAKGSLRFVVQARDETALQEVHAERDRLVAELERALERIETLRGRIAFCANCKDVKNEHDEWEPIDSYLASHSLAELSHGMCPRCVAEKTA